MRVFVYIDGFNLYYRALKNTQHKWLNPVALSQRLLNPGDTIQRVKYFTARISPRAGDPDAPRRQQILLSALHTLPNLEVHYGRFLSKSKRRPLTGSNPQRFVEVDDTEEKGSDVNLAVHLVNDGWKRLYDVALVMSQDTDLIEPLRVVSKELRLKVGLIWLDGKRPSSALAAVSSFVRHINNADLAASQFPNPIHAGHGVVITKPVQWT